MNKKTIAYLIVTFSGVAASWLIFLGLNEQHKAKEIRNLTK